MKRITKIGIPIMACVLIAATANAAVKRWRNVMPKIVIDVVAAGHGVHGPALMTIYGERGSNPYRQGTLAEDQRISQCQTVDGRCVTVAARKEFVVIGDGAQSLQIRLFNGNGNPIVGGLQWTGPQHPRQIHVRCDLRVTDVRKSCAISEVLI